MSARIRFSLLHVFAAVTLVGLAISGVKWGRSVFEEEHRRSHVSEQKLADDILYRIGGTYLPNKSKDRHITHVWVNDTDATDKDIKKILKLKYLEHLDVSNSDVSDASLGAIFSHPTIVSLKVTGSDITEAKLQAALAGAEHMYIEE